MHEDAIVRFTLKAYILFEYVSEGRFCRVELAVKQIAEALDNGGGVSIEMMNHIKAQILLAHLQLDELEQLLDSID